MAGKLGQKKLNFDPERHQRLEKQFRLSSKHNGGQISDILEGLAVFSAAVVPERHVDHNCRENAVQSGVSSHDALHMYLVTSF